MSSEEHPKREGEPARGARHYFRWRALGAGVDWLVYFAFYMFYLRVLGTPTADGYEVQGCGHVLLLLAVWFLWLPLPEGLFGKTFGKWATGMKVVNVTGTRIGIVQATVRHIFDVVDLFLFGVVGYLVARSGPDRQRVGDLVARTRVVFEEGDRPAST